MLGSWSPLIRTIATDSKLIPSHYASPQWSPTFLAPGTDFVEDNFFMDVGGLISEWFKYITVTVSFIYIVIYAEIITQLTVMQNQWEPWACFPATRAAVNTDEALLTCPPLTSCCNARFLTGHGLVLVRGLGVADPCSRSYSSWVDLRKSKQIVYWLITHSLNECLSLKYNCKSSYMK